MIDENDVILYIKNNPKFLEKNMDKFLEHDFYVERADTINLTKYHLKMRTQKTMSSLSLGCRWGLPTAARRSASM